MGSSNHRRTETGWIVLCFFVFATASYARSVPKDPAEKEKVAKNGLAGLLKKVSSYFSVKEARYPDSKKGGDSNFDRNSGNPGDSNTTYHSYVWDYCLKMTQGANCQKWLDPYVSQHGLDSGTDGQSPLESLVARLWKSMKKEGDDGKGGSYGIFDTQSRGGGTVLDVEGRLDRTRLTKFQLKGDVKKKVEQVGYESAAQTLSVTFNEDAPKNTMANIESLRLMAGRWTRMMRNRVVASLGELRANDKGTEFTLGEDMANCEDYLSALKQVPDNIERERIKFQGRLDPETFAADVRRRYQNCVQARNASVYMVNAKVNDGKVSAGNPNDEQIDKWKNRLNVAAIDYGGIDVNSLPKPSDQQLTESQTKSEIAEWKEGGTDMRVIRVSNGEQIESYNRQLRTAAQGMKEASVRSPFIPDTSDQILSRQIKPGSVSLVELNGLTPEMKNELKGTDAPGVAPVQSQANPNPDRNYEDTPSQLTISAAR